MNKNHTEDSLLIDKARQGNKEALNILMTKSFQFGLEKIADAFQKRAESI